MLLRRAGPLRGSVYEYVPGAIDSDTQKAYFFIQNSRFVSTIQSLKLNSITKFPLRHFKQAKSLEIFRLRWAALLRRLIEGNIPEAMCG